MKLIDLVDSVVIFLSQISLFLSDCDSLSTAILDFFLLKLVFVLHSLSHYSETLTMLLPQFPLTFLQARRCPFSSHHLRLFSPQLRIKVKSHLSPWFLAACAATITHRNYFFSLYQQNKSTIVLVLLLWLVKSSKNF